MPDPISRLEVCRREIDRVFGDGYAAAHPDVTTAVLTCATIDQAAVSNRDRRPGRAGRDPADIVPAQLLRSRP